MLVEELMKDEYNAGKEAGRAEGKAEGMAEGMRTALSDSILGFLSDLARFPII